jgi:hypothetical protein
MISYTCFDFKDRRAVRGKAARKLELINELRMTENDITHFIISDVARGDLKASEARLTAQALRDTIVAELLTITKEPK